ncbi:enoyl-CoA hydratase/isomerase family protein [Amycolatopsis jejuensis]|uniref:enoyl-CoA hydratase/isomerase family protein n=1 Tax=Amycolatopsis jejuensis TaxID=330084 RepID=UPI000525D451|nr:enoyl-CoA hydratase-related protein [Amycolatopsis jejuensis]
MSPEPEDVLLVERRAEAVWLTLNRPEKLNSINPDVVDALDRALDGLTQADRCVVLAARGRAFSAGGDLDAVAGLAGAPDPAAIGAFHASISAVLRRLELAPVPVVCVVQGIAVAGGLEIAAACDIVVAAESASFGDGHAGYGLLPGGGGSVRLPRKIGVNRAKYLMLTGRRVDAVTMAGWGLVSLVAPDGKLGVVAEEVVADLVSRSRDGLTRLKRLIDDGVDQPLPTALAGEQTMAALHTHSPDYAEGLAAFREKRKPRFAVRPSAR